MKLVKFCQKVSLRIFISWLSTSTIKHNQSLSHKIFYSRLVYILSCFFFHLLLSLILYPPLELNVLNRRFDISFNTTLSNSFMWWKNTINVKLSIRIGKIFGTVPLPYLFYFVWISFIMIKALKTVNTLRQGRSIVIFFDTLICVTCLLLVSWDRKPQFE